MASGLPEPRRSAPFKRLAGFVHRRRRYIVVAWIVALVLLVPVIITVGNATSLNEGTASGSQLESVQASNLISAQFAKTVANSTLLVVVEGANVSSPATQAFVAGLVKQIEADPAIKGLNQTTDVYSPLYSTVRGVDQAAYAAATGANGSLKLLLGVPALYFGAWEQAFSSTHNVTESDSAALAYAANTLSANATAYRDYSSHVLSLFNSAWASSWSDPGLANVSLLARGSTAAESAGIEYVTVYSPASERFDAPLLKTISLAEYLTDSRPQANSRVASFAEGYVANSTGFSQAFVGSAYALGPTFTNSSLYALVGNIIWNPAKYDVGRTLATLISSLVSPARDLSLVSLSLDQSSDSNVIALRSAVSSAMGGTAVPSGVKSAEVTGGDAISYDFGQSAQSDLTLILPITIVLLIVATGLFFRSILTPFMTLGTIGVALGISQVFIVLVAVLIAKVDFTVPTILLTILIGVGTDYSVFILARYREERVNGASVQQAVETSVTWAGESITTSGATVIISFLALTFTSVVLLRTIGYVVGLGVLVALLVALTMVPAIVGMVGERTFWPYSGDRFARYSKSVAAKLRGGRGYFSRSGSFAVRRAWVLIVLALVATGPALYAYANSGTTFDFLSAAPGNLQSVQASNQLTAAFGSGTLFPTYVVMTFAQPVVVGHAFNSQEMATVQAATSYLAGSPDVKNVTSPTAQYGQPLSYGKIDYSTSAGVKTFSEVLQSVGRDNKTVLFTVNFSIDPDSARALSDAQAFRQTLHSQFGSAPGVTGIYLGGETGSTLDTKNVFDSQFSTIVPIVAVGVALVLLVVLGSLILPVFAVLSVLMSIVWTLATTAIIFKQFYNYQILFITPFFLFVVLLGLGMDYNIFILTRIREEATKGRRLDEAIVGAIEQTGAVITAAAIILAGSLGSLMISSDLLLKQIGFALAYAILIDALVVRTYIVPAVMSKLGRWNWYSPIPYLNRSMRLFKSEAPPVSTA